MILGAALCIFNLINKVPRFTQQISNRAALFNHLTGV
jgi:hypothetical protein